MGMGLNEKEREREFYHCLLCHFHADLMSSRDRASCSMTFTATQTHTHSQPGRCSLSQVTDSGESASAEPGTAAQNIT